MISFFGITIMSTETRLAYRALSNKAYALHQTIWYSDDLDAAAVRALDAELADALSRVPASDIDSIE